MEKFIWIVLVLAFFLILYCLNNFFINKNLIPNNYGLKHHNFTASSNIPLSGGLFLIIFFLLFFRDLNIFILTTLVFISIFGFFADINFLKSPIKRFYLQVFFVSAYIVLGDVLLQFTRVEVLDFLLSNMIFNILFLTFCILVVLNGSNFIDGLNGLVLGYYLIISLLILYLNLHLKIISSNFLFSLIAFIFFLLILNFRNKLFLGDGGSTCLGFFFSAILIKIYNENYGISPFYIILLLWYPCFENLFSIIRKFKFKKTPLLPDTNHFHQLLFFFVMKKNNWTVLKSNNIASVIINTYNLIILSLGSANIFSGKLQIFLLFINIIVYCSIYSKLLVLTAKFK